MTILTSRHYRWLTAAFAVFIVYGSLVPLKTRSLAFDEATTRFADRMSRGVKFESRSDVAANILLFVPLGFVAAGAVTVDRKRVWETVGLIPAMALFSAGIEFVQLWFLDRDTTMNDVAAETLGGAVGVGGWHLFGQQFTHRARGMWANLGPGAWAAKLLPAYLVFLVIAHGMPFDLTISPYHLKAKYDGGNEIDAEESGAPRIAVAPFARVAGEKTLQNLAYFAPVGALIGLLPSRRWRHPDSLPRVFGVGLLVAAAVEALQVIVLSAGAYASDILIAGLSVLGGWWLTVRPRPLTTKQWGAMYGGWVVALLAVFCLPLDASRPTGFEWTPFADYQAANYLSAFNRILNKTVLFVPLGFFAVRSVGDRWWHGPVSGAIWGGLIEAAQSTFTTHRGSVSDVILAVVGAGFGGLIALRAARWVSEPLPPTPPRNVLYSGVR